MQLVSLLPLLWSTSTCRRSRSRKQPSRHGFTVHKARGVSSCKGMDICIGLWFSFWCSRTFHRTFHSLWPLGSGCGRRSASGISHAGRMGYLHRHTVSEYATNLDHFCVIPVYWYHRKDCRCYLVCAKIKLNCLRNNIYVSFPIHCTHTRFHSMRQFQLNVVIALPTV